MDLMKKIKQEVDEQKAQGQHPGPSGDESSATHADSGPHQVPKHDAEPERDFISKLIVGTGHTDVHHGTAAHHDDKFSLLDKLTRKEEREKKAAELAKQEAEIHLKLEEVAHKKKENESFLERIRDHFDGEQTKEHSEAPDHVHGKLDFLDKLTGKKEREERAAELDREEAELQAELERVRHEKRENEGVLQRLKDHLEGDNADGKEAKDDAEPSLLDKITGKAAEQERLRKEEEQKTAFDKMKDRLNEEMGGGCKAKENEDMLDKSILSPPFPRVSD